MNIKRIYLFDNLKAILILFVVFGHALESLLKNDSAELLYLLIYSFHMPLFAFCSGFFASFQPDKIKRNLLYPFLIFQTLYLFFDHLCLKQNATFTLTKPYWLMWYLFALIIWEVALPFVDTDSLPRQLLFLCLFGILGILVGYDQTIGYYLSLSRILVYFPFFLLAYYIRKRNLFSQLLQIARQPLSRVLSLIFVCAATCFVALHQEQYKISWLYGAKSYEMGNYNGMIRLQFYLFALLWLFWLLGLIPNRTTCLTAIGQSSLSIYLLHGFFIKYGNHQKIFQRLPYPILAAFFCSVLLVFLLSRNTVRKLATPLFYCPRFRLHSQTLQE